MKEKKRGIVPVRSMLLTLLFTAAALICMLAVSVIYGATEGQHAAETWENENSYAQISVFCRDDCYFSTDQLKYTRNSYDTALDQASIYGSENGRLWIDAYSYGISAYAESERSSVQVNALAVGGDFFVFHPFELEDGEYFASDWNDTDKVVIDDYAAWQLFGAINVAGFDININGQLYKISGVVKKGSGRLYEKLYGEEPRIYVNAEGIERTQGPGQISCYEILLPDPVKGFAMKLFKGCIGLGEGAEFVENSSRFGFFELFDTMKELPERSVRMSGIVYPYWENSARVAADKCAVIQFFECIAIIAAAVSFTVFTVLIIRNSIPHIKRFIEKTGNIIDKIKTKKYYEKNHKTL